MITPFSHGRRLHGYPQLNWMPVGGHDGYHGGVCGCEHHRADRHHHPAPQGRGAAGRAARPAGHVRLCSNIHMSCNASIVRCKCFCQAAADLSDVRHVLNSSRYRVTAGEAAAPAEQPPAPKESGKSSTVEVQRLPFVHTAVISTANLLSADVRHALLQACGADV